MKKKQKEQFNNLKRKRYLNKWECKKIVQMRHRKGIKLGSKFKDKRGL